MASSSGSWGQTHQHHCTCDARGFTPFSSLHVLSVLAPTLGLRVCVWFVSVFFFTCVAHSDTIFSVAQMKPSLLTRVTERVRCFHPEDGLSSQFSMVDPHFAMKCATKAKLTQDTHHWMQNQTLRRKVQDSLLETVWCRQPRFGSERSLLGLQLPIQHKVFLLWDPQENSTCAHTILCACFRITSEDKGVVGCLARDVCDRSATIQR